MPSVVIDPAVHAERQEMLAVNRETFEKVTQVHAAWEHTEFEIEYAETEDARGRYTAERARLADELADLRSHKATLAARMVAFDLDQFRLHYPPPQEHLLVPEDATASMVMLSALVEHQHDRASGWLCSHTEGVETVLGIVDYMCGVSDLPLPIIGIWSLPIEGQIRALSDAANVIGAPRIVRAITRRSRHWQHQRDRAETVLSRYAKTGRPTDGDALIRYQAAEDTMARTARTMLRYQGALAYLAHTQTTPVLTGGMRCATV